MLNMGKYEFSINRNRKDLRMNCDLEVLRWFHLHW